MQAKPQRPRPSRRTLRGMACFLAALVALWTGRALPLRHFHHVGEELIEHVHLVFGGTGHHQHGESTHVHHAEDPDEPVSTHGGHDQEPTSTLLLILAADLAAAPPCLAALPRPKIRLAEIAASLPRRQPLALRLPRGPPSTFWSESVNTAFETT